MCAVTDQPDAVFAGRVGTIRFVVIYNQKRRNNERIYTFCRYI